MHPKSKIIAYGILRALGIIAGIVLLLWFIYKIQAVIAFIAIAAVISLVGRPIVNFLKERLRFSDAAAAVTTILIVIAIIAGILSLFIPILIDQSAHISQINFEEVKHNVNRLNVELSQSLGVDQVTLIEGLRQSDFIKNFDISVIPLFINGILGNMSSGSDGATGGKHEFLHLFHLLSFRDANPEQYARTLGTSTLPLSENIYDIR